MSTDSERREATDKWTIELREQQLRDLRAQLAAANQRAETAEAALSAVPVESLRYCFLTELDDRDDEAWSEHTNTVLAWLQFRA